MRTCMNSRNERVKSIFFTATRPPYWGEVDESMTSDVLKHQIRNKFYFSLSSEGLGEGFMQLAARRGSVSEQACCTIRTMEDTTHTEDCTWDPCLPSSNSAGSGHQKNSPLVCSQAPFVMVSDLGHVAHTAGAPNPVGSVCRR